MPATWLTIVATCPRFSRWALTDGDGRWSVPALPRGKDFIVTVSKTGYAARSFGETPPQMLPVYVDLKDGQTRADIDVALVPHTIEATTFGDLAAGDAVNLEVDVIAKYVESMLERRSHG